MTSSVVSGFSVHYHQIGVSALAVWKLSALAGRLRQQRESVCTCVEVFCVPP